jgi:hypothetical protein
MRAQRVATVVLLGAAGASLVLLLRSLRLLAGLRRLQADPADLTDVAALCGALALAAALSTLAATRLRAALRTNLALALASGALVLYAFEILQALRDDTPNRYAEKLKTIEALRQAGISAYGGVEPVRFVWARDPASPASLTLGGRETLPLAGIAGRTTVDCRESPGLPWLIYEADEHGFRNPPGLWGPAPIELAAVGDSFTAGSCVPPDENLFARLRQTHPGALNLGMPGSGPLLMLATLREYLPALRPGLVLWCHYGGNDLRDLRRERGHAILERYLENGFRQGLAEQQAPLDAALDEYDRAWLSKSVARLARRRIKPSDVLTLRSTRARLGLAFPEPDAFAPPEEDVRLLETVLAKARATVESWQGRLYFVYLPPADEPPQRLGGHALARIEFATRRRVLALARALGLPVIDVTEAFAAHPEPDSLFACPGCHYSEAGYRLAADAVRAGLAASAGPR